MIFYFGLAAFLLLSAYTLQYSVPFHRRRQFQTIWCGGVLAVVAGLRAVSVGADTTTYVEAYQYIARTEWGSLVQRTVLSAFEPGYVLTNKAFALISADERFFLIWTSVLSLLPVIYLIGRYSRVPVLSFVLYIFTNQYLFLIGVIRQTVAMSFVLMAFSIILDNKRWWIPKALVLIAVGTTFHTTAILAAALIPFYWIKKTDFKYYVIVGAATALMVVLAPRIASFLVSRNKDYSVYVSTDMGGIGRLVTSGLVYALFLVYKKKIYRRDPYAIWWEHILVITMEIQIFSYWFLIASRAVLLFNIMYCIIIPNVLRAANRRNRYIIGCVVIAYFMLLFVTSFDPRYAYAFCF